MKSMPQLRRGAHSVFALHVHLVFVAKYRRKIYSERKQYKFGRKGDKNPDQLRSLKNEFVLNKPMTLSPFFSIEKACHTDFLQSISEYLYFLSLFGVTHGVMRCCYIKYRTAIIQRNPQKTANFRENLRSIEASYLERCALYPPPKVNAVHLGTGTYGGLC